MNEEIVMPGSLDTEEICAVRKQAEDLAGDDRVLKAVQTQQCKMNLVDPGMAGEYDAYDLEPIQICDNLYFTGSSYVGGFIFTDPDGIFIIDSGWQDMTMPTLIGGMKKLGLDPSKIRYMAVTHFGPDHFGAAYYLQKTYGTRIIMSREEWDREPEPQVNAERIYASEQPGYHFVRGMFGNDCWPQKDIIGKDGDIYSVGSLKVHVYETARRVNGGGLSYIVENVYDNGQPHVFATYGNTNVVGKAEDIAVYHKCVRHFCQEAEELGVDMIISDHPFVDDSIVTMQALRERKAGEPNPFVRTKEWALRFLRILDLSASVIELRQLADLNESGNGKWVPNPRHFKPTQAPASKV